MPADDEFRGRRAYDFRARTVDNPDFFEGYRLVAMNAAQMSATHRRIEADINGEYHARWIQKRWAMPLVLAGVLANIALVVIGAVDLAFHTPFK